MLNNYSRKLLARIVASSHCKHAADLLSATQARCLLPFNHALATPSTINTPNYPFSTSQSSQPSAEKKIYGSILLERLPVVAPPRPQWFVEYRQWQMQDKQEDGHHKEFSGEFERLRTGGDVQLVGDMEGDPTTHKDMIEAAENDNLMSPWRRLDRRIFFLCKLRSGSAGADGSSAWTFPAVEHSSGETIRQTAERALNMTVDRERVKVYVLGNSPACHWETEDALIFYFRAQIIKGDVTLTSTAKERYSGYALLAEDELDPYFPNTEQRKLFHDVFVMY